MSSVAPASAVILVSVGAVPGRTTFLRFQSACEAAWVVLTTPVAYSRTASPPRVEEPVRLMLAATSAAVKLASSSTKVRPNPVEAISHP